MKPLAMASVVGEPRISQKGERLPHWLFRDQDAEDDQPERGQLEDGEDVLDAGAPADADHVRGGEERDEDDGDDPGIGRASAQEAAAGYSAEMIARAAMLAELMMRRLVQPKRKAGSLPNDSWMNVYCPPAFG